MDVAAWLQGLGLERYVPAFRDNEIDWEVLPKLTSEDLREIGVAAIGHRRKLLAAIAALGAAPSAATAMSAYRDAPAPADAERRQLTVMFCDLVGSTSLSSRLDPEDLREVIAAYHRAVAGVVAGLDGFVAKYMGDGVLVYFGYPRAHEDDAERAVRAGLCSIDAVGRLDAGPAKPQARVGIATGLVVVGDLIGEGSAQEQSVVGETPNLAARLQSLATPGSLVIAASTREQIGEFFDLDDLGPQQLAGFAEPQRAWRVLGESGVLSRFEALRSQATPLIGRNEELDLLRRRWQQVKTGEGRVVLVSGEPGIGKSRLTAALARAIEADPHIRLRYFCSPHHQDSALHPFLVQLTRAAGFSREDSVATKQQKLADLFRDSPPDEQSLLAELLSLPATRVPSELDPTPQRKKEQTFDALLDGLERLCRRQPVLLLFEDLHWMDPTSRELLDRTVARVQGLPALLIATFRPEFQPPWTDMPHVTSLPLNRLGRRDGAALVQHLIGGTNTAADLIDDIVERSDGVPLFLEEVTKAVIETAGGSEAAARGALAAIAGAGLAVPPTLQASLMARLDRLGPPAKEVAQIGAVIGREFPFEILAAVAQKTEAQLHDVVERLVDAGLVFRRGTPPHASLLFKHALVQDTAYGSLLRGRRRALHRALATVLEERFPETAEAEPERLARHFTEAGLVERAISYWERAGQKSLARPAMIEAIAQLRTALDLLATLPASEDRLRKELDLLVALGSALFGAKGMGGEELGRTHARARELLAQLPDTPHLVVVFYGSFAFQLGRSVSAAHQIGEELLQISGQRGDSTARMMGHRMIGMARWHLGRQVAARSSLEQAVALYDPSRHRTLHPEIAGVSMTCRQYLTFVLTALGFLDQAVPMIATARAELEEIISIRPRSPQISTYYFNFCVPYHLRRDVDMTAKYADRLIEFARQNGLGPWSAAGLVWRGWVRFRRGERENGAAQMRQGLADYRSAGTPHVLYYFLGIVADVEAELGRQEEGLALLAEATALQEGLGAGAFASDLLRIKGDLLTLTAPHRQAEAEACYRTAIGLARQQQTRFWELRAAVSLGRLWLGQGDRSQAFGIVAPVYRWFTEGLDAPDLRAAQALLDEAA